VPLKEGNADLPLQVLNLLAKRWLRYVQPSGGMRKIQLFGSGDEVFKMAKFHDRLRSSTRIGDIASSWFAKSNRAKKDPCKDHIFAIMESNEERLAESSPANET
jgi:hypothetical protein